MFQVATDCQDPVKLGEFRAAALGYVVQSPPPGFADRPAFLAAQGVPEHRGNSANALVDPRGQGPRIFLHKEHSDLGVTWAVMTDPEGNEFCA